ncbi:MAG: [ribosomal protein S5]-alanine N-acetyltransferase, partial [Actinomycetota bacterium]|nr:[ribosomal protein S5]-alanine N-acetyltransferase [Actinomycetota bacterium]
MAVTRPLLLADAPGLADVLLANRDFLAPWQPNRPDQYFTRDGQRGVIERLLEQQAARVCLPLVILDEAGGIAGTLTLQSIIRGAFQSCSVGYWLAESAQGRGLATRAVREASGLAFQVLRLHRVQAETLTHNLRSQRVLDRLGFVQYGRAEAYMHIAGEWQDNLLYQLLTPTPDRV